MLEIKNLEFSHQKSKVINNLSADFEKGKLYCIIGPNGCGKTTLVKLISGLLPIHRGEIILDGKKRDEYSQKEFAKKISLLPQEKSIPEMAVEQLVFLGRYPYLGLLKSETKSDRKAVDLALKTAGVEMFKNRMLSTLSGGERQSVYLAMLLAQDTPFILLDEPSVFLDVSNELALMKLLKDLAKMGKCVIAVLHNIPLALAFGDEILVMEKGEIKVKSTPESIVNEGVIKEVFGVEVDICEIKGKKRYVID